jgi:hypothetical protein
LRSYSLRANGPKDIERRAIVGVGDARGQARGKTCTPEGARRIFGNETHATQRRDHGEERLEQDRPLEVRETWNRGPARGTAGESHPAPEAQRASSARQAPATSRAKGKAARGGIGLRNHHMDYTSHSMDDVKRFYTELLGFLDFDFDPEVQYLYVRTGPSLEPGFHAADAGASRAMASPA